MLMNDQTVRGTIETLVLTPFRQPEILPTVLPLIFGALIIELYFGKYETEELGWNSSVANAVIWTTTGITLLLTTSMTQQERFAAYILIGIGALVGYMNFYHKWPDTVAFIVSSSGLVYTLAYISVIVIKTSTPINRVTLEAAAIFFIAVNVLFKLIQGFETPRDRGLGSLNR
jgi:hypothetical protein